MKSQFSSQKQGTWPKKSTPYDVLVVGGGGAGGKGGGGGGGLRTFTCQVTYGETFSIVIGAGGSSNYCAPHKGNSGVASSFGCFSSAGGGGGGGCSPCTGARTGSPGGSGGGSAFGPPASGPLVGGTGNQPPVSPPQGNAGGGSPGDNGNSGSGGGGGSSSAGTTSPSDQGGPGGAGSPVTSIFGTAPQPYYLANVPGTGLTACGVFAGGGGGGPRRGPAASSGGVGGGGNSARSNPNVDSSNGVTNSGGGGGAFASCIPGTCTGSRSVGSRNGGSGIVMVRVPSGSSISVTPCTNTVSCSPVGRVAKFTVSGNITIG